MQNKLYDRSPSCLIHCCFTTFRPRASEPRTTTFCARFNSRSYNAEIIQLQSALDDEYNGFSGNIKPIPHFKLFSDVHFGAVSLIHSALQRLNDATLRKVLAPFSFSHAIKKPEKKLELLSAAPRPTLTLLSCSPNFPRASHNSMYAH